MSIPTSAKVLRRVTPDPLPGVSFDVERVRKDFPILQHKVHGKPLVYLDNAASTQKPQAVLDALSDYYSTSNANVHRGVHSLSERATRLFEEARVKVQHFIHAAESREIIFVRGATEAINLVAHSFARPRLRRGDEILITHMEHHANIVPWQIACEATGAVLKAVPINADGELVLEEFDRLLTERTRLVAVVHLSNSLGTVNPVRHIIERAHAKGVPVLLDGAQSASHLPVHVRELDCDFFAFSGHKLYGPTGIGVLYGKAKLLESMPPYQGGGDMIKTVTLAKTTYADLPNRFEAGTPHIAGAVGLGAAIDYLQSIGLEEAETHEEFLLHRATEKLREIRGVRILGNAAHRSAVLSFVVEDPPLAGLDVGARLDMEGIAVRTGHHCCQPLMDRYGIPGTIRASFALYNSAGEVDHFADTLARIVREAASRVRAVSLPLAQPAPAFPPAVASSPDEAGDELADLFDLLEDWTDRYHQIMEMGEKLPPMPADLKTEANRVHGCQSVVHMFARVKPGTEDVVEFLADSNADLVRGLIALLERLFSGQPADKILAFDIDGYFDRLGLDRNLTLGRRNGLAAMVERIRGFAAGLSQAHRANGGPLHKERS